MQFIKCLGKLQCSGDSLTVGLFGGTGGWRRLLFEYLPAEYIKCQAVGPYNTNSPGMTQTAHGGLSGDRAQYARNNIASELAASKASTVILGYGMNDMGNGRTAVQYLDDMTAIINICKNAGVVTIIVLDLVLPTAPHPYAANLSEYLIAKAALPGLAASLGCVFVPFATQPQLSDGVHLVDGITGNDLLADYIFTVIAGLFPPPPSGGLMLDYIPSAAAYSLRQLRSAYTGPLCRVRRDNGDQVDLAAVNGQLDTASLLSFCGAGGNGWMTTHYDQSGNGRNAVQPVTSQQAMIVNSGILMTANGKPTLSWPSTSNTVTYQTGSSFTYQQLMAVAGYRTGTETEFAIFYQGLFGGGSTIGLIGNVGSTWYSPLGFPLLRINGGSENSVNGATALPLPLSVLSMRSSTPITEILTIGSDRNTSGRGWSGPISEMIAFAGSIATTSRKRIEANQKAYYGT